MKKKQKVGWEISSLTQALLDEHGGKEITLTEYCKSNPLSAINIVKNKFILIRKYKARVFQKKIQILNAPNLGESDYYPLEQPGLVLVDCDSKGASEYYVGLPVSLTYKKVTLKNDTITIHHSEGETVTNFKEIRKLQSFVDLSEQEMLDNFKRLVNHVEPEVIVETIKKNVIKDVFFGKLILNVDRDDFESVVDINDVPVNISFSNTTEKQMKLNLRSAEKLVQNLDEIERAMIVELLPLKNDVWLEEDEKEITAKAFKKEVKVDLITIYDEGHPTIYFNANDLFGGHDIEVRFDENHEFEGANIVG